jgi:hypothetical protein
MRQSRSLTSSALTCCLALLSVLTGLGSSQSNPYERSFPQSKTAVEKAIKQVQPTAGRLPVLDGFARSGDRPLDRFQRGYYQCAIQVSSTPSGGSMVRISAKITAWYADPVPSNSGYQVLSSNGRLETDFLDRIEEILSGTTSAPTATTKEGPTASPAKNKAVAPVITAPKPSDAASTDSTALPQAPKPNGSPFKLGNGVESDRTASLVTQKAVADKRMDELTKEATNLAEILRNQAHPNNLVAVKKANTPVLVSPIEGAKVLFLAAAEDEFEILDMSANWIHIRISGLSRGWIRRSSVEMPEISNAQLQSASNPASPSPEHFQVKDEQTATFPGTWEPLRGKTVMIATVQQTGTNPDETGPRAKLEYTKTVFEKMYAELKNTGSKAEGVVVIFDSADGGMAAAILPALEQWRAGTLSDQAFWRRCWFDPPEAFSTKTNPN